MFTRTNKTNSDVLEKLLSRASETPIQHPTIGNAFVGRLSAYISDNPFRQVMGQVLKFTAFVLVSVSLFFNWDIPTLVRHVVGFQNGLLIKIFLVWLLIYNFPKYKKSVMDLALRIKKKAKGEDEKRSKFGGLDKEQLLDFLFDHKDLNIVRYMETYKATRKNDLTAVIKALQAASILVKGPNNSNVLNESIPFSEVEETIQSSEDPAQLVRDSQKIKINHR